MSDGSDSLEDRIVNQFLNYLESSDEISNQAFTIISNLSDEDDFGGRDQIADSLLRAVSDDED